MQARSFPFNTKWSLMCSIKLWIKHPEGFISVSTCRWWGDSMRDGAEALSCRSSLGATVAGLVGFFSSNVTVTVTLIIWLIAWNATFFFFLRPACYIWILPQSHWIFCMTQRVWNHLVTPFLTQTHRSESLPLIPLLTSLQSRWTDSDGVVSLVPFHQHLSLPWCVTFGLCVRWPLGACRKSDGSETRKDKSWWQPPLSGVWLFTLSDVLYIGTPKCTFGCIILAVYTCFILQSRWQLWSFWGVFTPFYQLLFNLALDH